MEAPSEKRATRQMPDRSPAISPQNENQTSQNGELLQAELLATVSHELRSPLTAINGYASTLLLHEYRITPEERREFLLIIKAASQRLEKLISQMLEVALLETDQIPLLLSPVNLVHLMNETIAAVEESIKGPQIPKALGS